MFQYSQGTSTTQGHKGIPEKHFEEEQGRKGFHGPVSHLIKPETSTRWSSIEGSLRPHLFDTTKLERRFGFWQRLLFNDDVQIYLYWDKKSGPGTLQTSFRNSDGETLYFCHSGLGHVLTEYGAIPFEQGSYIVVPKCITHSFVFDQESCFLIIESRNGMYREPERGMVGRNAFYDPASFVKPDLILQNKLRLQTGFDIRNVYVKRDDELTKFTYEKCYLDTIGWKGDFFPFALHIRNLMPITSHRVHLPPSVHTTFACDGFVVCTFLPRPLEQDPDALKVPFYHQNIDYDEVLFYHAGDFFSRDNVKEGMMSFHPAGFPHGPHPKAQASVSTKTHTDEVAVMVDSKKHLKVDPGFLGTEFADYWKSWQSPGPANQK